MIPEFPNFGQIGIEHRNEVVGTTKKYPPYSDYDFTTLWAWNVENKRRIAKLNGNLVVQFTDYLTGEAFFSFFGSMELRKTIKTLFEFAHSEAVTTDLRFVPDLVLQSPEINDDGFAVVEDPDNHDYIYSIDKLVSFEGHEYGQARNLLSRFLKRNGSINVKQLDLSQNKDANLILEVNKKWQGNKGVYLQTEEKALKRLIDNAKDFKLETIGIFIEAEIVAYAISELLYSSYAISHFAQANTEYAGVYAFLMRQIAIDLQSKGCKQLNYEQDLGLPNLRQGKMSYRPVSFLKKLSIVEVD